MAVRALAGLLALSALPACGGAATSAPSPSPSSPCAAELRLEVPEEVLEPGGNVLFTIRPPQQAAPLGVLEPGAQRLELPLRITATRCDGHALAESKRSYVLSFFTAVGDGAPHLTTTTADPPLQRQLDRLAQDACRPG